MASTTAGGIIETKEIGLAISVDKGTYHNTFFDSVDNTIKLKIVDTDGNDDPVYTNEGYWISEVINLQDKFKDFDKIFTTHVDNGSSNIAIQTRVSDDSMNWSDWTAIAYDGKVLSELKQYIQIKIVFYAGYVTDVFLISEFDNADDVELFDSEYIDTSNGLRLKREYEWDMTKDSNWSDEGSLYRKAISRDEWLRIDRLNVKAVK